MTFPAIKRCHLLADGSPAVIADTEEEAHATLAAVYAETDAPLDEVEFYRPLSRHDLSPRDRWPDLVNAIEARKLWIVCC
jgi:hypothetical protein